MYMKASMKGNAGLIFILGVKKNIITLINKSEADITEIVLKNPLNLFISVNLLLLKQSPHSINNSTYNSKYC